MPPGSFSALDLFLPFRTAFVHTVQTATAGKWRAAVTLIALLLCLYSTGCTSSLSAPESASATPTTRPLTVADLRGNGSAALSPDEATLPVSLSIPAIDLEVEVQPMGWIVVEKEGERVSEWDLPEGVAGWHLNSELAGTGGNVVISGRQTGEGAVFAPLALGEVEEGQELLLTDADGRTFVYQVSQVSEPIPAVGATAAEEAQAAAYLEKGDRAILTLVTGWPEYTTTHRLFIVADLIDTSE